MFHGTIMGNLGIDPILRSTASGGQVLTGTIATNQRNRNGGEDKTVWVNWALPGARGVALAKAMSNDGNKALRKGVRVVLVGQVSINEYVARDGTLRSGVNLLVNDLQFAGGGQRPETTDEQPAAQPAAEYPIDITTAPADLTPEAISN